jgi:hypothetical protein
MAGTKKELFQLQAFNFNGANGNVVLVRELPVVQFREGVLAVRVHSNSISAGTYSLNAYAISNTPEEPDVDFRDDTAVASVSITSSDGIGSLLRDPLDSGFGGALQIVLVGASSVSGEIVISAELTLKD